MKVIYVFFFPQDYINVIFLLHLLRLINNMKYTELRDSEIFQLWCDGASCHEIAKMWHDSHISRERIENIVYGGHKRLKSEYEHKVYRLFRIKFLEFEDIPPAIDWVWENQPKRQYTVATIFNIIRKKLKANEGKESELRRKHVKSRQP